MRRGQSPPGATSGTRTAYELQGSCGSTTRSVRQVRFKGRQGGEDHACHNGKARRTTFARCVVAGVPVQVKWPVVEVGDVDGRNTKFEKRNMVVLDSPGAIQE